MSQLYIPHEGPPQGISPSREIYGSMGRDAIFAMCEDFYAELETSPIRHMFAEDMPQASRRLAAFLVQLLGGPPVFNELYGTPVMRSRHLKFKITQADQEVWRDCFYKVLENPERYSFPEQHLEGFKIFLDQFSAWMISRKPSP